MIRSRMLSAFAPALLLSAAAALAAGPGPLVHKVSSPDTLPHVPLVDPSKDSSDAHLEPDPGGAGLFFLSTAFTPPKGTLELRAFELLYASLGYAPTGTTNITVGTVPGVYLNLGARQQVWINPARNTAAAVSASVGKIYVRGEDNDPREWLLNGGAAASRRFAAFGFGDAFGVHANAGYWGVSGRNPLENGTGSRRMGWIARPTFGAGAEARAGSGGKFMLEYLGPWNPGPGSLLYDAHSIPGFLNAGGRAHGKRFYADAGVLTTILRDSDDGDARFFFMPLLVFGYRF